VFDDIPPPPPPPFCQPRIGGNGVSPLDRLNKEELVALWRSSESELRSLLLRAIRAKEVTDPPWNIALNEWWIILFGWRKLKIRFPPFMPTFLMGKWHSQAGIFYRNQSTHRWLKRDNKCFTSMFCKVRLCSVSEPVKAWGVRASVNILITFTAAFGAIL
jgi:hypothetical protein